MDKLFEKIYSGFVCEWKLDDVLSRFGEDQIFDNPNVRHRPYSSPNGKPHWQVFPGNISFARNFYINFSKECDEVAKKLESIQKDLLKSNIDTDNNLIKEFLNHKIKKFEVNLIRIFPGVDVSPHFDITRSTSINIGLQNSSSGTTHIINGKNPQSFIKENALSYTMNDGDVFILSVKNVHSVTSNVDKNSGIIRYIITYNMTPATL